MIWPDNIPDEVVKAARQAWLGSDVNAMEDWRVAIAAALRAWPGVCNEQAVMTSEDDCLILPLRQGAGDV